MKNFFKSLKSEKGVTGIDVVMASAMIMVTITVVSILYVNTSLQTRNIKRTAGATRIATNIAENIQALTYEQFVKAYKGLSEIEMRGDTEYRKIESVDSDQVAFSTKIPKGYVIYIYAPEVYGSHEGNPKEQFDLVRAIDIIVQYNIGKSIEEINFSLTKQRELVSECNSPDFVYLKSAANKNIFPVKYNEKIGAYMKTTTEDIDWYDYSNKKWAVVMVSDKAESEVFDANGKYTGVVVEKYAWVPAFFTDGENDFRAFRYKNSNKEILPGTLTSLPDSDSKTSSFNFYTFDETDGDLVAETSATGLWVDVLDNEETMETATDKINKVEQSKILNASKYGPYVSHK